MAALLSGWALLAAAADPQVAAFNDTPDPVAAGGTVNYLIRVDNNGADASQNTVLTMPVPPGAVFVSAAPAGANCVFVPSVVTCSLGAVAPGGADVRNIDIVLRALGPGPTSLNLTATVSADNDTNPGNNSQSQTTTVINGANLALAKTDSPDPVVGGANVTYTLTPSNAGPNDSAGIRIVDNLPPSTTFVSTAGPGWTCSVAGSVVTCLRPGPHPVGAAIPPLVIVATVNASGGTVTNSATVDPFIVNGVPAVEDPVPDNNTASASTTVLPGADVRIDEKAVTSGLPAIAGSNVTFRIQPRNGGPAAALNAVVTDVLPAGWTYVSASGPNWACSASGQTVTCTRANFPVGATDDVAIVATAPPNAAIGPNGTNFTNTASIASSVSDPNSSNNSGSVVVPVLPDGADLRIAKTKTPNPVAQGSPLVSTVTVTNNGPRIATGPLKVVELLPAGETFVSASGSGWTCTQAGLVVTCTHPNAAGLAVGASLPAITINTIATAAGTLTNTACSGNSVPGGSGGVPSPPLEGDPNPTNDCASAGSTSTTTQPDLGITKLTSTPSGGDKTVSASESSVTYTLVVTNLNAGADNATGVRIVDTVPAYIAGRTPPLGITTTVSGGSTATFACAAAAATVTCTQSGGALAPGQTVTVAITVQRPLREGTFTNTATVSNTAEGDPNGSNNTASDTVTIAPIADVEMSGKSVTPGSVRAGENATYVLSYRNIGPSPAAAVTVTDTIAFPPGDAGGTVISIVSSKAGSSCTIAAGAQLTPASNVFSCTNSAAMANDEVQSITLVLRPNFQPGNAARVFGNTASVSTTTPEDPSGGDGGNNSKSATLTVAAAALDLLVNKTDFVDPIGYTPGATFINYRVRTTNNGPSFGTGVTVNESMQAPAGKRIRYVCDTTTYGGAVCNAPSLCSAAPGVTSAPGGALVFTCSVPAGTAATGAAVGTLAAGASKNVFLRFEALDPPAPTGDVYLNTAAVVASEPDTFPGNNSNTEPTTIRQLIDLQTAKSVNIATLTVNQPFIWTVTVTNAGPANSLQTILRDTLPAGVALTGTATYVKTTPAGNGNCVLAGVVITCTMGALDNAGVATITIPARFTSFPPGGTATNTATVGTNPADTGAIDTNAPNNTATSVVTLTRSSLAGTVFRDRDGNGSPGGPGESGIAAVALALAGTDAYGNVVTRNATTAADGTYSFTDLPPANASGYTITQTQPAGYTNGPNPAPGTADSLGGTRPAFGAPGFGTVIATIPVGAADTGINYNFPEIARPAVSGTIYRDNNNNGVQDPGETGIAGATVQLFRTSNNTLVATLTTDASGNYSFTDLDPISYYVLEPQPAGFLDGLITPGLVGGVACVGCSAQSIYNPNNEAATISRINGIDLASGDSATLMNFGELVPSTLAGSVFVDLNTNGLRDPGEPGIASVAVTLTGIDDRGNSVSRPVTTDASGNYSIGSLRPSGAAGYTVTETQPAGFGNGPNPPAGTADSLGGTRPSTGAPGFGLVVAAIPVAANQAGVDYRFGEISLRPAVSGTIYRDNNNNGVQNAGETGIAGAAVQLYRTSNNTLVASLSTDANGNYLFADLDPVSYYVVEPQPAGFFDGKITPGLIGATPCASCTTQTNYNPNNEAATISRIDGIDLTSGANATLMNFGELVPSTLAGSVYIDLNANGLRDSGEPGIAGVAIALSGADDRANPVTRGATTDANGNYSLVNLRPAGAAGFTVTETQPVGFGNGPNPPAGTADSLGGTRPASGAVGFGVVVAAIPVAANENGVEYRFGEVASTASVSGTVFIDTNRDGLIQPTETGRLAGVTIQLINPATGAVIATTTTDANGNYVFSGIVPGNYRIVQTQPAGYGSSTPNTLNVSVPAGGLAQQNFGETAGSIAGKVFLDTNNDGIQQPGEAGIAAVTILLVNPATNATLASLVTDADGAYRFDDLIAASYTVREPTQPPGTVNGITSAGSAGGTATSVATLPSAVANIALPVAAIATGYNFAEIRPSSLSGAVYNDLNNNGIRDPGEPGFANATLVLTGPNDLGQPVSVAVTTGADGNYTFTTLRPGTYTVTQPVQPPGSTSGITSAGSTGGSVTPSATNPSAISGIGLGSGVASISNNFGEIGLSPDVVGAKQAVGIFATGNDALYRISIGNIGQLPTVGTYTVQDRLPTGIVLAAAPNGTGWSCTGAAGASDFTCIASTVIPAGSVSPQTIAVPVRVLATATGGATSVVLNNPVIAAGGGENIAFAPSANDSANFATNPGALPVCAALSAPAQNACRTPTTVLQSANVSGTVWYDIGTVTRQLDSGDTRLAGWTVEVLDAGGPNAVVVRTLQTGADGNWRAADLLPNRNYVVRFREPNAGIFWGIPVSGNTGTPPVPCVANNANSAQRSSCVERTDATQLRIVMQPGDNLVQQSLPVDPSGVVYDAVTRQPVPGSIVTFSPVGSCPGYNPATHIANAQLGGFTIAGNAVSMTVGALGAYEFLLTPSAPTSCQFQLVVTPPPSHSFISQLIPPQTGSLATPPAPGALNVQAQGTPPAVGQATTYYLTLSAGSGTQNVLHNHIPLDPRALTGLVIQKTGSTQIVELGDSMQYTVVVRNTTAVGLGAVFIDDALPAGFRFIPGTAAVTRGGLRAAIADPAGSPGPNLTFALGALPGSSEIALTYRVRVGVGAAEGNGINTAQAKPTPTTNCAVTPQVCSNEAQFQVRVQGGVFTTDSCLAGKVFVDCNGNHVQDPEELGIPGVRLWLQDGTFFITDSEGKYSYCGVRPILHVLKVDRSTLPVGSRLTESSNRNVGDPGSLMLDIKKGELHRGDFIEGSCANPVVEQVKARRTQGEVRGPETEGRPAGPLRFRSKPPEAPRGATDSADQRVVQPRPTGDAPLPPPSPTEGSAARP